MIPPLRSIGALLATLMALFGGLREILALLRAQQGPGMEQPQTNWEGTWQEHGTGSNERERALRQLAQQNQLLVEALRRHNRYLRSLTVVSILAFLMAAASWLWLLLR